MGAAGARTKMIERTLRVAVTNASGRYQVIQQVNVPFVSQQGSMLTQRP